MAKKIGFYNATHTHGEPDRNLLAKLKARRAGGAAGIAGGATHLGSLDLGGEARNRAQAPMGEMPPWVAQQIARQGGLPAVPPGGIPADVTPTKPSPQTYGPPVLPTPRGPKGNPYPGGPDTGRPILPVQGSDRIQYPVSRRRRALTTFVGRG